MKIVLICFSPSGWHLAEKTADCFRKEGQEVTLAIKCAGSKNSIQISLKEWVKEQFETQDAIVFISAAGIAVRMIAPYLEHKTKDPAVLVMDELGNWCIPILSGHIGGANELARFLGRKMGIQAVITTATDVHEKWTVDVFATKNRLQILDMKKAKAVSAKLIAGEKVTILFERGVWIEGEIPDELTMIPEKDEKTTMPDIYVGVQKNPHWKKTLYLVPKVVTLGIGCKKGTRQEQIEETVSFIMKKENLCPESLKRAASVDLKAKEAGLLDYCETKSLDFQTYSAKELNEVEGHFNSSAFVLKVTGVDNICERSAVRASGNGKLLIEKYALDGVTVAFAMEDWGVEFE